MKPEYRKTIIAIILVCLVAPIKFTLFGIPFVLQSFALFTAAAYLGVVRGMVVSVVYLLLGTLGLPIFAGFQSGVEKLVGPTAGFLWSFPLIAAYIAWQCRVGEQSYFHYITYFFRAHILWLVPGMLVLYYSYEGVDLFATTVKLMPDLLVKSSAGGALAFYLMPRKEGGRDEK